MSATTVEGFRISPQQEHLWLLQQGQKEVVYRTQCNLVIQGNLDEKTLNQALQKIIDRHEILRTKFVCFPEMTIPVQMIQEVKIQLYDVFDLSELNQVEQSSRIQEIYEKIRNYSFDFADELLFKTCLIKVSVNKSHLIFSLPALCGDQITLRNLAKEIAQAYTAELSGEELFDLPLQYADFAEWQHELLQAEETKIGRQYWQNQDFSQRFLTQIAGKNITEIESNFQPEICIFSLDKSFLKLAETLAGSLNTSLSNILLTGWLGLLWRLAGQSELIVGIGCQSRNYEELVNALGLFEKYLPLKANLAGDLSLSALVNHVQEYLDEINRWQESFAWELISESPENSAYWPYCFNFIDVPETYQFGDFFGSINEEYACTDRFQLKLCCSVKDASLKIELHYDAALFSLSEIQRLAEQFSVFINSAVKAPNTALDQLEILSDRARHQLLVAFNQTQVDYPKDRCIHQLFAEQVQRTPNQVAVTFGNQFLTYAELNSRANQLAHYLHKLGVKPEVTVGICVERSLEMMVGILGILKAGGAYVPLDPTYPADRLAFIVADAEIGILLTQERLIEKLPNCPAQVIAFDTEWDAIAQESSQDLELEISPENLVYLIYTSGSTGQPKGVEITHQNLVHSTLARLHYYQEPIRKFLLLSSFAFDSSVAGIFWTLCQGGTLSLPPEGLQQDVFKLVELIADLQISHLLSLPSLYSLILQTGKPDQLASLRTVIVAGEACPKNLIERHLKSLPITSLFNEYGPTEGTVWSSVYHCESAELNHSVPIGRPIANMQIYLLDAYLQPVPIGVIGEVYISGEGLARGYRNQPELTVERFIQNPFVQAHFPQSRLYKTGDLARYLPDGNIEFIGRTDQQVKIRGFRIEIGEIEGLLNEHPAIEESVIVVQDDRSGNQRLVAYIVGDSTTENSDQHSSDFTARKTAELRNYLQQKLPDYMIPSAFVFVPALPLMPNGKVDRKTLAKLEITRSKLAVDFIAPSTPTEEKLAQIWADLLRMNPIGIHDNFFDLGGHSLLTTQLMARIRATFQMELPLRNLFETPTIAGLAATLEQQLNSSHSNWNVAKSTLDLSTEVVLDGNIHPGKLSFAWSAANQILLTGATGFVGAFLLAEILQKLSAKVYCLVRAADIETAYQRLQKNLETYSLWNESYQSRILPILGNLAEPLFGLAEEEFDAIAQKIDVIYHNGAQVNFTYPYSVLKAANVLGTQEVLRLAAHRKIKPVHFISATSVFPTAGSSKIIRETDPLDLNNLPEGGYAQSKWVAEKLIEIARDRGLPANIYRLGRITGHSQTGIGNPHDLFARSIKGCIQLGCVADHNITVDITPVDYATQAIVYLAQQKQSLGHTFHILNPQPTEWQNLVKWLRCFGYPLQTISYSEWREKLLNVTNESSDNALYPLASLFSQATTPGKSSTSGLQFDCEITHQHLAATDIVCPTINFELFNRYLSSFVSSGFIEAPSAVSA